MDLGDGIVTHGSVSELRKLCGIDAETIAARAVSLVKGGEG